MSRSAPTADSGLIRWAAIALVLLSLFPPAVCAETRSIGVLYPDIREPYRSVFLDIIEGIRRGANRQVEAFSVSSPNDLGAVEQWLNNERIGMVIALGNMGMRLAKQLPSSYPVIFGAILTDPDENLNGHSGITLTPDPYVLFQQLRRIAPQARRVTVVYNPDNSAWLIERARDAAHELDLSLTALPADNVQEAATLYSNILRTMDRQDALWLPQDSATVDEQGILPFVLREAWDRNLVVFSSNLAHVRRGALFALYPDNVGLGRSLAELALERLDQNHAPYVLPLKDLLVAVNVRTAEHIGLNFSGRELRRFDLVFPSR